MAINQVKLKLSHDIPLNRLENQLEIGNEIALDDLGIEKIHIRFNGHYHVEIKQKHPDEVILIITSGGVSREIDPQTFQHLITMNY